MKPLVLWMIALAAFPGSVLQAQVAGPSNNQVQDITGTWQGLLRAGQRDLRVVFKISVEDNKLKAVFYSIDQGSQGRTASDVTRQGATIKIAIAAMRATYEGKLAADGKTMAGNWSQGTPLRLNLTRATPETAWAIPDPQSSTAPMSPDANPVFEVATIKPSQSSNGVLLNVTPSGLFTATGISLSDLIKFAYDLHPRQLAGGPSWFEDDRYDVTGKPDKPGKASLPQLKAMVQKLLADRFQLTFHREKREISVYAIGIAKSGLKLPKNDSDPNGLPGGTGIGPRSLNVRNITLAEFATMLQAAGSIVDRPVVDRTELGATRYDFVLRWTPDGAQVQLPGAEGRNERSDVPPDFFAAFQEQLGLRLESTKAPVDVLVIDRVQRPSPN